MYLYVLLLYPAHTLLVSFYRNEIVCERRDRDSGRVYLNGQGRWFCNAYTTPGVVFAGALPYRRSYPLDKLRTHTAPEIATHVDM